MRKCNAADGIVNDANDAGSRRPPLEQFGAPHLSRPFQSLGEVHRAISGRRARQPHKVEEWNVAVAHPPGPPADRRRGLFRSLAWLAWGVLGVWRIVVIIHVIGFWLLRLILVVALAGFSVHTS
jgi:hypothetical protein